MRITIDIIDPMCDAEDVFGEIGVQYDEHQDGGEVFHGEACGGHWKVAEWKIVKEPSDEA